METITEIKLNKSKLRSLQSDVKKSAEAVQLVYVSDREEGIKRVKKEDGFIYKLAGKEIKDEGTLTRIKHLVIPPAWEQVWICTQANGHLQCTGVDAKGRKQYKYHAAWNNLRNQTKFYHLYDFGKVLPAMRARIQKDLSKPGLPLEKVLAAIVAVMECTCIRIGNNAYEKLYGSYGLTTLKDKHVSIEGSEVKFNFKGKKGVFHDIGLKSRKLANIVKQCRDIPGKDLFQYYDDGHNRHNVESGTVNNYIKEISGGNFSAKDFRTWVGSLKALEAFKELGESETETAAKKVIVAVLDTVAKQLGNTRTVCKKYYVHPLLIDHYSNKTLSKYLNKPTPGECTDKTGLSAEEQILMKILEDTGTTTVVAA